jgi:hypothetical protein
VCSFRRRGESRSGRSVRKRGACGWLAARRAMRRRARSGRAGSTRSLVVERKRRSGACVKVVVPYKSRQRPACCGASELRACCRRRSRPPACLPSLCKSSGWAACQCMQCVRGRRVRLGEPAQAAGCEAGEGRLRCLRRGRPGGLRSGGGGPGRPGGRNCVSAGWIAADGGAVGMATRT